MLRDLNPGLLPGLPAAQIEELAHQRFIESFLRQTSRSQPSLLPVAGFLTYLWWTAVSSPWVFAWMATFVAMVATRYFATERLVRIPDAERSTRRVTWILLCSGVLQVMPVLAFPVLSDTGRGALTLILVTLSTVSVASNSGYQRVFLAYTLPILVPLALAWMLLGWTHDDPAAAGLGLLILVFQTFLLGLGAHANEVFMEGCIYRFGEIQRNRELQAALAEADEANRAKSQFLAAASHDLRQPIHSMAVLVGALNLRPLDGPTKEIVGLLGSVNQILSRQLDTLLDISKLDAGVVRADMATCRLDLLVRNHHAALAPLAAQRGLRLELQAAQETWVHTDAALLGRALSNLSDNALKYTPVGGLVRLGVRPVPPYAELVVEDTGIGIPDHEHERVFREFYQVGNVERDRSKGLGLGLSIVQRLCRLMSVDLKLQSAPGVGTTLTLRLPLAQPAIDSRAAVPPVLRRKGLRVLVVDDEAIVRHSTRLLLQGLECEVFLADSVAEADAVAQRERLDFVMSDLRLRDGESGIRAIEAVRAHCPSVAAVLITGDTEPRRIREAEIEASGVPVLFKPVTPEELARVMPHQEPSTP